MSEEVVEQVTEVTEVGTAPGERGVVEASPGPRTRASLAADLRALGVEAGDTLLAHASLRSLGWVVGRQVAVVQALLDVVGPAGTVAVPTQSGANSDPSGWQNPPVPEQWWPTVRAAMPAYDPRVSPGLHMGAISEAVRTWPGACRSGHPQTSFAALGARAAEVVAVHDLDSQCGERSPLAALERLDARVLFLGTGWDTCTALHLAEYRVPSDAVSHGCSLPGPDGSPHWVTFDDVDLDADDFETIGASYVSTGPVGLREGHVGSAAALLFPLRDAVAHAAAWMSTHRGRG